MRVLVTGAGGMMGSHFMDFLAKKKIESLGTYFRPTTDYLSEKPENVKLVELDVRDYNAVYKILSEFKPDKIFHLAAQSYPTVSWEDPWYTIDTNIKGTVNIFEAVKKLKINTVIIVAGSSAEYGFVDEKDIPVKETHELKPLHPYGVSKLAQENLAYQYFKNFGIKGIPIRIFNTTGPRKVNDVCSDFTKQAVMIEKGLQEPIIRVGNLEAWRGITDVRDAIEAFWLIMERGKPGEVYNFSGARAYKVEDLLNKIIAITGIQPKIYQDPKLMRPTDEKIIFGDATKLKQETGWNQKISIDQTLEDMVNYWRKKL